MQKVKLTQESNTAKQELVGTEKNPLKVEVIDHMRSHEPGAQAIFITAHMVSELNDIAKELRNVSLILIDEGVRYSLKYPDTKDRNRQSRESDMLLC